MLNLPHLEPDDWKNKDSKFWRDYLETLISEIHKEENKIDKTIDNIYKMAKENGIKPTARYFNMQPNQVRYYVKKYENDHNMI